MAQSFYVDQKTKILSEVGHRWLSLLLMARPERTYLDLAKPVLAAKDNYVLAVVGGYLKY